MIGKQISGLNWCFNIKHFYGTETIKRVRATLAPIRHPTEGFMCTNTDGYKPHVSLVHDVNFYAESQEKIGRLSKLWLSSCSHTSSHTEAMLNEA